LGYTLVCLTLITLNTLAALVIRASSLGFEDFCTILMDERTLLALRISLGAALIAALVNVDFGVLVAWVLVRYDFPGRRLLDALVDLPFALPTAVAGIALAALYANNGWIGLLFALLGIKIAFTPAGIVVALIFIGLPFVVRTVQPVMEEIDRETEEAAATLGANGFQTIRMVLLPTLPPAILTGLALAFARAVGKYRSVIFIAVINAILPSFPAASASTWHLPVPWPSSLPSCCLMNPSVRSMPRFARTCVAGCVNSTTAPAIPLSSLRMTRKRWSLQTASLS
jgi:sulfate transport system permease protein